MSLGPNNTDWDTVPDDELYETPWERLEALKEIFPVPLRRSFSATADWTVWLGKRTFSMTKSTLWIGATSGILMLLPVIIEKELAELAKSQIQQQQQMLLGPVKP
ncbi:unnamed protein product [Bursaphelenchus xylophilus]|uniref:Mitochondrial import receptor subunit TOM22 homolog n=1 Tax=Bursaphelenchus xylophilus TaxID=6326 RepID=A0A1I7SDC9_BURXY|nr:unnamed protein product [Bursaphelenchus xylophilus]CAG9130605.1 unnamed protein product [Bursaphelenchus xylophilus]